MMSVIRRFIAGSTAILVMVALVAPIGEAQTGGAQPAGAQAGGAQAAFKPEELEQIVAPIALYPDPLIAQVFMASTYPIEVVQAARFVKANPKLTGDALNEALKNETWDDSVKALVVFPQVLEMMNEKLDWMQKLGDAFLGQQKETMDAVQRLRARAQASGNLKTTKEQKVIVEPAAAPSPPPGTPPAGAPPPGSAPAPTEPAQQTIIKIEPANPQVVYVPTYQPAVVYGGWPYPAYPPYYYYPPGYVAGAALFSFGVGMAVGGALWGNCNWGGGDVDIDVNKQNSFSRNVNKTDVAARRSERQTSRGGGQQGTGKFQHNPEHRKGAQYRDSATQQRFNKTGPSDSASREAFRGRAEQGRQEPGRTGGQGGRDIGGGGPGSREAGAGAAGGRDLAGGGAGGRDVSRGGAGGSAFDGVGQGRTTQNHSQRGSSSLNSARSSGFQGGGGTRAGGGGRAGGGRGGGRR